MTGEARRDVRNAAIVAIAGGLTVLLLSGGDVKQGGAWMLGTLVGALALWPLLRFWRKRGQAGDGDNLSQ